MEQDSVRRCHRCGASEVIIVNRWEGRWLGVIPRREPVRTEHRCQACGASFNLTPWLLPRFVFGLFAGGQLLLSGGLALVGAPIALGVQGAAEALVLLGLGLLTFASGGVIVTQWSGPQVNAWRNPVVPGATRPELRLGPEEQWRRCLCGEACSCSRVSERSVLGVPLGRTRRYDCPHCGDRFSVDDIGSTTVYSLVAVAFVSLALLLASLLPLSELNGSHFFVLGVLFLGAGMAASVALLGTLIRRRHPTVG